MLQSAILTLQQHYRSTVSPETLKLLIFKLHSNWT